MKHLRIFYTLSAWACFLFLFQNCSRFEAPLEGASLASGGSNPGDGASGAFTPPSVPAPNQAGQYITYLTVKNLNNISASSEQYMTVGQVFAVGEIPSGKNIAAKFDGVDIPIQLDKKAFHADGSLRHGILTFKVPSIPAGSQKNLKLYTAASGLSGTALSFQNLQSTNYEVVVSGVFQGTNFSVSSKNIANPQNWLSGPLATEFNGSLPLNPFLEAYFDIRLYQDGSIKTDVEIANDWAQKAGVQTFTYDVVIKQNGQTVYSKNAQKHNRFANWKRTLYSQARSKLQVVREPIHWRKTNAILNYATDIPKSEAAQASLYSDFLASDHSPNGGSVITKYMPQTGGRSDIGPETKWTAFYILHQDPRMEEVMLGLADAGGSIPWHYRNPVTKRPVTRDEKPEIWLDDRCGSSSDCPVETWTVADTDWQTDTAHHPSLYYIPYMITGDRYYLDQLQMMASAQINMYTPYYFTLNGKFYFNSENNQTRGAAWSLRTVLNAAYLTPDADTTLKAFFNKIIDNDLENTKFRLVDNDTANQGELAGYITGYSFGAVNQIAPWQDDFVTMVWGYAYQRGYTKARALLEWQENYTAGRFLQPDSVFCANNGPGYYYTVVVNGVRIKTWKDLYTASFGNAPCPAAMDGYNYSGSGYTAMAYAANATMAQYGLTRAKQAIDVIKARSTFWTATNNNFFMTDGFPADPTFAISPVSAQSLVAPPEPLK